MPIEFIELDNISLLDMFTDWQTRKKGQNYLKKQTGQQHPETTFKVAGDSERGPSSVIYSSRDK